MSPASKDTEMVLERTEPVKPQETQRIFCASRGIARELLRGMVLMLGALRELELGKVDENHIKLVAVKVQEFLANLGDKLMIDCGLTEKDINKITKELGEDLKKR